MEKTYITTTSNDTNKVTEGKSILKTATNVVKDYVRTTKVNS